MNTNIVKILVPLLSLTLLSCKNRSENSKNNNKIEINDTEKPSMDINFELNAILKKQGKKGATGIAFTLQCPKYNNGNTTTYNVGLQKLNGKPVKNSSLFQIGSNSKAFLVVVMLQLEAEGKLSLEDKLSKFFPNDFPKWQNVTIKQMLNMTSGIPEYTSILIELYKNNPKRIFSTDEILSVVKEKDLSFSPGSHYFYSNTNYVLANKIIEKITEKTLATEIENRIFKKLNLNHSFYINHIPKEGIPSTYHDNIMSGYLFDIPENNQYYGMDIIDLSMSWTNGGGSITTTSNDLNLFIRNLFSEPSKDSTKNLLNASQLNKMLNFVYHETDKNPKDPAPQNVVPNISNEGYGLGIVINYLNSLANYSHTGGTMGFLTKMNFIKDKNISYVYLTNAKNSETFKSVNEIVEKYISEKCL
jgi:D-alanyl-D-alanine carboxypeptidase